MLRRTALLLSESLTCAVACGVTQLALGATAIALVTVTVIGQATAPSSEILVLPTQLSLAGKTQEQLTIFNQSADWREIGIELKPVAGIEQGCTIRYSPKSTSIPPHGLQVVRLLVEGRTPQPCLTEQSFSITDLSNPAVTLYEVPINMAAPVVLPGNVSQSEFFYGGP